MNELFREARQHGAVPLNEATRALGDDKSKVRAEVLSNGHGFGWTPGVGDGQGGLACCSPWGRKESDTTE